MTENDYLDNLSDYIRLDDQGRIVYESYLGKRFPGDFKLLLSCIEDHCWEEGGESGIDFQLAIRDYRKARERV